MIGQEPVQAYIWHCLNHYAYKNATFLAESLHAEVSSEETAYLLATCYYRSGRLNETHFLLQSIVPTLPHARFLLAKCSMDLKKYKDAENALGSNMETLASEFGEQAPYALQLLGKVYNVTERRNKAADVHRKVLALCPFMWDSFAELCNMGEKIDPNQIFQMCNVEHSFGVTSMVNLVSNTENISLINTNSASNNVKSTPNNNTPRTPMTMSTTITPDTQAPVKRMHSVFGGMLPTPFSPSFGMLPVDESPVALYTPTLTDSNEQKALPKIVNSFRAQMGQLKEAVFSPTPRCALGPAPRRSSRLFSNNSSYSVKENNKSPSRKFVAPKSPSRKNKQRSVKSNLNKSTTEVPEKTKSETGVTAVRMSGCEALLNLLRGLGEAYRALASLDCKEAIRLFYETPPRQFASPWVQTMLAKAHYELAQYEPAARIFAQIRRQYPRRTEGMEIYSTCLWHLQKEAQLSALAQDLVSLDRSDPIAWLAAGNCFSLHKERETALRFFKRAVQLDPDTAYSHALLGHEYAVAEETEKALASFRTAVSIDPRNYSAWFGIATVYSRQERWKMSEAHIRRALQIHPTSGVLRCQLGLAQAETSKMDRALATIERAVQSDPQNPLCWFHHGSLLLRANRPQEALPLLLRLKDSAPRESLVYYMLGKVYSKLGNPHLALMHYSWATDLDPKGTGGHIKEGFDPSKPDETPERTT